nr:uncharacterized protein LOC109748447 [Aegilops tauschii subsp. strangulata]
MDEIITSGSAAATSLGFQAQDDTMDLTGDMDDELDYGEEEEEEEEDPAPTPNADTYWECIKSEFDERKLVDPYFATIHMQRGSKAMSNHWAIIQMACNKWHGIVEEIAARLESGANVEGQDNNTDQEFKYLHVFSRIEKCEKWADVRRTLAKAKETYKPDAPTPGAADGRPDGNKRAKMAKDAAPATERLHASIEQCIADAKNHVAQREEKSEARWSVLMTNNAVKLDLLRTNVVAKKWNTNLAFMMGADMSTMDEQVNACVVYKGRHRATGQTVAIKFLGSSPDSADEPADPRELLREARFLEACSGNPHVVGFHCTVRDPDTGEERRIVHRDIKPGNVLVLEGGEVLKICDFGLAPRAGDAHGKPDYDALADAWSLGCVMAELVSGDILLRGVDTALIDMPHCPVEFAYLWTIFGVLGTPDGATSVGISHGVWCSRARRVRRMRARRTGRTDAVGLVGRVRCVRDMRDAAPWRAFVLVTRESVLALAFTV